MSAAIPTQVLSDALHRQVAGRRIKAAVFTTYSFEPGFFEQEVVPTLFAQSFSHVPRVRLVQLEEALREVGPMAVYFDRGGLSAGVESATLDIQRVPITVSTGVFHPKLALVLLEPSDDDEELPERLVVAVMSANLTRSGWWENVECAWNDTVDAQARCGYRGDLLRLLTALKKQDRTHQNHTAADEIWKFLTYRVYDTIYRSHQSRLHPRLHWDQAPLPNFAAEVLSLAPRTYHLEVVSPFFDAGDEALSVRALVEALEPKSVRICEPRADDGTVQCSESLYQEVADLPGVTWARLPKGIRRRGGGAEDKESPRYVHAKVYRLWSQAERQEFFILGSPNMTRPGHAGFGRGNFETAVVFQAPYAGKLGFWLEPSDAVPSNFRTTEETEEGSGESPPPLSVQFDWDTKRASYFWEIAPANPFTLLSDGVVLAEVASPIAGAWEELPEATSERFQEKLRSTSILEVGVSGETRGLLLVSEIGMAKKPSILLSLTPEEILRYWSLLSPEQREAFIEDKAYDDLVARGLAPPRAEQAQGAGNSMFDRFAGIFHAFAQLEEHVQKALDQGRESEAVYRVFGEKHDSLPYLLRKVVDPPEVQSGDDAHHDPLMSYVTVLTAQGLITRLQDDPAGADFFSKHGGSASQLQALCKEGRDIGHTLDLGEDGKTFLAWFERHFTQPAAQVESS